MQSKKILIIGSLGYIGSKLFNKLSVNFEVIGIDNHFFSNAIFSDKSLNNKIMKKDIRKVDEYFLKNFQIIILLAGISNDPLDNLDEDLIYKPTLNYSIFIADVCKKNNIKLIFPSSCSIYGYNENIVNEKSKLNPLTGYSRNKVEIENYLTEISDSSFQPVILRFATIYGISPRMRFDIVVNMLCGMAITKNEILLNSDGESWRPHLHIDDAISVIEHFVNYTEKNNFNPIIINVGKNDDNFKVIDIAKIIVDETNCNLKFLSNVANNSSDLFKDRKIISNKDSRSYIVNFDKVQENFSDLSLKWNIKRGVRDLLNKLKIYNLTEDKFLQRDFYRLQQLEYMYKNNIINKNLEYK